jgi:hypothetical protein
MSVFHENMLIGASGQVAAGGISRSLRFNSSDSGYLSRAVTASNRKKWSFSFWFKKTTNSQADHYILDSSAWTTLTFNNNALGLYDAGAGAYLRLSAQVFRDPSAWYYILVVYDSDNATAQNRLRFYCNGVEITTWQTNTTITPGFETRINGTYTHTIGTALGYPAGTINGYLADIHFIDGQALDPTSFGEFDTTTGVWNPKAYTGTFTGNSFKLTFEDNSSNTATTLGKDTSGNGNNWTPNNLSVTAGAGNDSLVDVPTNGTASSGGDAGGVTVGNYCVWNPLQTGTYTLSNGNLEANVKADSHKALGTISVAGSDKWYAEITIGTRTGSYQFVGLADTSNAWGSYFLLYRNDGVRWADNGAQTSGWASYTTGDVIGIAYDASTKTASFYKNNSLQGTITTAAPGAFYFAVAGSNSGDHNYTANFGQRPFAYTAPSGFKALCTANLPAPLITKPSSVFGVALDTGANILASTKALCDGTANFLWIKDRVNNSTNHRLIDIIRDPQLDGTPFLASNSTSDETTLGTYSAPAGNSVGWGWYAGGSTVTNTAGSITGGSQVRANPTAGFSIVTYTGTGTNATVGHGLGAVPGLIIVKPRSIVSNWITWHSALSSTSFLYLNGTDSTLTATNVWNSTLPTSTVFSIGTSAGLNTNGATHVAYVFSPVVGYSNGFSYTGNGSTDGSFVYLGFRPRLILLKCSSTTGNWTLVDTAREGYNVDNDPLYPNLSDAEGTTDLLDITSNGFKLRTTDASVNSNAATYIGFAWAESPFNYSRAR